MIKMKRYASLMVAALWLPMLGAHADDTEIFFADADTENAQNAPAANVLVMLDSSGSMAWCETSDCQSGEENVYPSINPVFFWCYDRPIDLEKVFS